MSSVEFYVLIALQTYPGNQQPPGAAAPYPGAPPSSKVMPPPAPQPRRHPDFAKDQQTYPPYSPQRPVYPGWTNSNSGSNNQFRGTYPGSGAPPGQWAARPGAQPQTAQWDQQRFPPPHQPPFTPQQVCTNSRFYVCLVTPFLTLQQALQSLCAVGSSPLSTFFPF